MDTDARHINFKEVYWRNQKKLPEKAEGEKAKGEREKIPEVIGRFFKKDIKAISKSVKISIEGIFSRIMVCDETLQRGFDRKKRGGKETFYGVHEKSV